jgi:hypothetical protein
MAMTRQAKQKKTPTTEGKQDIAIPKKATKPATKHEPPSLNRKERRKQLVEQGLLIERNVGRISTKAKPTNTTSAPPSDAAKMQQSASAKMQQGEKIYACLHTECNETFEVWMTAKNHMNNCKVEGNKCEGKPKIAMSRKKGNQLLVSGVAAKKEYPPLPTDVKELVKAICDFFKNKKNAKGDESFVMRRIIQPQYGSDLEGFETLGFGTWEEFIDANPIFMEDAEVDSESVEDAEVDEVDSESESVEDAEVESESE